ncbi:MAG: aminotransferase class IV [Candidatus Omnitrophica bacterium]|nr:aminotransferase class IV [Candidatus Omnitrophota bacterium]
MEIKKISGLFETMRCLRGKIVHLDWHLERLRLSAKLINLKLPVSRRQLENEIYATVKLNCLNDARVRVVLEADPSGAEIFVSATAYQPFSAQRYQKGFSAITSSLRQDERCLSARIKSTNRALYNLSLQEARKKGFDEAIILNQRGNICEGARSNIFFRLSGELFTPALANGCLPGVIRRLIFDFAKKDGLNIYEGNFTLEDLAACNEAFLTNSLMGVMPLTRLGAKSISGGKAGRVSRRFLNRYQLLLRK